MRIRQLFLVACQFMVGGTFVFGGISKSIDPVGTSLKIEEYLQHFGLLALGGASLALAWALALFELALGFYVIIGRHRAFTSRCSLYFLTLMTLLTLYLAIYNPIEHCGCFGDALVLSNWETFWKNIVLLGMTVWLYMCRLRPTAIFFRSFHTLYFYVEMSGALVLLYLGTWMLPIIDFRPYRPGVSLVEKVDDSEPVTDYVVVYERAGEQREFSLEALPEEDSGWEFVETRVSKQDQVRQVASHNLVIFDEEGTDVSQKVLADTGYVMLLLSPDLREAKEHDVDCIENLYEYALEQGYPFYCLTLKDGEAIEHWRFHTGAEYPFLYSDQQVIETMIRSNPGFMLLHNGIILWKSHLSGINVPLLTSAKLSEQSLGQIQPIKRKLRVFWIIVWMIAPLLLYLPLQIIHFTHKKITKK